MRIISTIVMIILVASLAGCLSYSRHDREDRVIEHRSGSYHGGRSHRYGGYYRDRHEHRDHHGHHRHRDRHHPHGH
jgi:hypothetical protein